MLKTIVVALDGSELAERVMKTLQELIVPQQSKVILCHVFPPPDADREVPVDRPHPESAELSYLQVEKRLHSYQQKLHKRKNLYNRVLRYNPDRGLFTCFLIALEI